MRSLLTTALVCVCALRVEAQVTSNDVRYAAERVRTQQDAYAKSGGDLGPINALVAEGTRLTPADPVGAYRAYTHGMALVYGGKWTPETELATCVDFNLNAKVVGPGDFLKAAGLFLFDAPAASQPPYRLELEILGRDGARQAAVEPAILIGDVRGRKMGDSFGVVFDPSKFTAPGEHTLRATLKDGAGATIYSYYRSFVLVNDLSKRLDSLRKAVELSPDQTSAAATTARWVMDSVEQARKEYSSLALASLAGYLHTSFRPERGYDEVMDFDHELSFAQKIADGLGPGRNPLAGETGSLHLAYRSSFDGKLMPYRVYVPAGYNPTNKYKLMVMLHGSGGDENVFLGNRGQWQELADARGYILAAPNGRGPVSGYAKENGAQQDVLDVLSTVQKLYSVDPARVYLTGHSMGGMGTWTIGMANRDRFVAIAPMAGTRPSNAMDQNLASGRKIPILITCGGSDPLVQAAGCRTVADKAKSLGYPVTYLEFPNDNHWMVVGSSITPVFDFFDKQSK